VRGISNYVAALMTVTMIFTSVAFFITFMLRQVETTNYALNTIVKLSDRAREDLGISYVIIGDESMIVTIVNRGTVEVSLAQIVYLDRDMNAHILKINGTIIPIGGILNLNLTLPVPASNLRSVKITTTRGNVFDVLSSTVKPLGMIILVNATSLKPGDYFEVLIIVRNALAREVLLEVSSFNVSLVDHVTGSDLTHYFAYTSYFPPEPVQIPPDGECIFRIVYQYSGGLSESVVDVVVLVNAYTTTYEVVYSSAALYYAFTTIS